MSIFQSDRVVRRIINRLFKWIKIRVANTFKKRLPPAVVNFARVGRFRLEIGIGVARIPWVIFASGMSESEEKIGVARLPWVIFASGMSESEEKIGVA